MSAAANPAPFDGAAAAYDRDFTFTPIARRHRLRVWQHLPAAPNGEARALDLGCGTGEDARQLAALGYDVTACDASAAMLAKARDKNAGLRVRAVPCDLNRLDETRGAADLAGPFSLVLSNFGALNCVRDLPGLAAWLEPKVAPRGRVLLVVMGPDCLWEQVAGRLRGDAQLRQRRRTTTALAPSGDALFVQFPTPTALAAAFAGGFTAVARKPIGLLLPPQLPRALDGPVVRAGLDFFDRLAARLPFGSRLAGLADHYLLELERRP